ncbi:polysaccharide pyruvyl transferase family protein [Dyadobacter sp. LHD-138]|uniref:polysaccharide pyruvyl transferase family protein n=1 Tax=Dyadobacter sp. LHD-138 TaxID=3071413 RepID=UPI0027E21285|nr:polysaccharide pyruvyl transferase family protein [Dyadobacter sp. LHD-138]MDQ6481559.1 polysaccharide pyruvyl transferase family protein [Dyadobacter sp. LHD-138]
MSVHLVDKDNKGNNFLLLGVSFNSDNRGVNALGIGAATIIYNERPNSNISILCVKTGPWKSNFSLDYNGGKKNIDVYNIRLRTIIWYVFQFKLLSLFKIQPNNEFAKLIMSKDLVFNVNEGDSFSDIYGLRRIVRHFCDSYLVLLLGKKLTFLPQTIGPFKTPIGTYLGKYILKRCHKIFVRDTKAFNFLDSIPVKYKLHKDMAVFMQPKFVPSVSVPPATIGLNINGLMYFNSYASMKGKYDNYKEFIHQLIKALMKLDYPVLLVPHTYNPTTPNGEDDLLAIKELKKDFSANDLVSILEGDYNAQELKYIISQCDFFLGSRMHSCIAGLSTSVPTIGLAYSYKFEGTFANFNQKEQVLDLSSLHAENIGQIVDQVLSTIHGRAKIREELTQVNEELVHFSVI